MSPNGIEFRPEFVNAYEIGTKAQWLDGRLTTNLAAFWSQYEDFQLNTFTGLGFVVGNVDEARTRGVELEYDLTINEHVFLTGGWTYAKAQYGDAPANPQLENRRLTHAPTWQGSTGLNVEYPVTGTNLAVFGNLNAMFRNEHNTGSNLKPQKEQGAFWLFNGQLGVRSLDGRYEGYLWSRNILDRHYNQVVFDSVFQAGSFSTTVNEPRTFGATLRVNL